MVLLSMTTMIFYLQNIRQNDSSPVNYILQTLEGKPFLIPKRGRALNRFFIECNLYSEQLLVLGGKQSKCLQQSAAKYFFPMEWVP